MLLVDDEPLVLDTLDLLLSDQWTVHKARSADEAKKVLHAHDIAVIVSDERMPGESGVELLRWSQEVYPGVVRILLTAYADATTVARAIERGRVWHYIRKPWDNRHLIATIQQAMDFRGEVLERHERRVSVLFSLVVALESTHPASRGHSSRVARLARRFCDELTLPDRERRAIVTAARLHDIGRVAIDDLYLDKRGPLDDRERNALMSHVDLGLEILVETGFLGTIVPIVATHHERVDGGGYPGRLSGEIVPLGGRILAIADAFEAMTSYRTYRARLGVPDALGELRACSGTQFDKRLVREFCAMSPGLEDIVAHPPDDECGGDSMPTGFQSADLDADAPTEELDQPPRRSDPDAPAV